VQSRASVATLTGDIHGDHWQVLRQLLPLYQALTSVRLGDDRTTSFWSDVWHGDEALADTYPALFTHCNLKDATVSDMVATGIQQTLVHRLSQRASTELLSLQHILSDTTLQPEPDKRITLFSKGDFGLDSGAIYQLLKARGQPNDARAKFIWENSAPPRVQLFMWLLVQRRIQSRSVLHTMQRGSSMTKLVKFAATVMKPPDHIVGGCQPAIDFWQRLSFTEMQHVQVDTLHTVSPDGRVPRDEFSAFLALCCWQLWKARNAKVFRQETLSVDQVLASCQATAELWRFRLSRRKKPIVDSWCQFFEMARQGEG
jgi:hypothetical protein